MEKLPSDLPENVAPPAEPANPTELPRIIRPSTGRIWFFAILFFFPLLIMIIFSVFLITSGVLTR